MCQSHFNIYGDCLIFEVFVFLLCCSPGKRVNTILEMCILLKIQILE